MECKCTHFLSITKHLALFFHKKVKIVRTLVSEIYFTRPAKSKNKYSGATIFFKRNPYQSYNTLKHLSPVLLQITALYLLYWTLFRETYNLSTCNLLVYDLLTCHTKSIVILLYRLLKEIQLYCTNHITLYHRRLRHLPFTLQNGGLVTMNFTIVKFTAITKGERSIKYQRNSTIGVPFNISFYVRHKTFIL